MTADTVVSSSFKGTSLEFRAVGLAHLILTETNEHILFKRPDNSAINLVFGKLFVDVHGTAQITNVTKNIKSEVSIQRKGWSNNNLHKVEGKVLDKNGSPKYEIEGTWIEYLNLRDLATGTVEQVFRSKKRPENQDRMYFFSYYACNLNYLDEEMKKTLPPTDCRRRPDQRLMEEG
jgi:hypothetical protein